MFALDVNQSGSLWCLLNIRFLVIVCMDHGHPESLFWKISNFWAWADIFGLNFLRHLGYFRPDYQHPFWYCEYHVSIFNHYIYKKIILYIIFIWEWYLKLAAKNLRFSFYVSIVRTCVLTMKVSFKSSFSKKATKFEKSNLPRTCFWNLLSTNVKTKQEIFLKIRDLFWINNFLA